MQVLPCSATQAGSHGGTRHTGSQPIYIISDADLVEQADVNGWPGTGTEVDPYVLSGLDINGSGKDYCVRIEKTTLHVTIESCILHHVPEKQYKCHVLLADCSNVTLSNLTIGPGGQGVSINRCQRIHFRDSTVRDVDLGIGIYQGAHCGVTGCRITDTISDGIGVTSSTSCRVKDCEIQRTNGITILSVTDMTVENVTVSDSDRSDVYTRITNNLRLANVTMNAKGIYFEGNASNWETLSISGTNTVGGKPLRFLKDQVGGTVQGEAGQVVMVRCSNVRVSDIAFENVSIGIQSALSTDLTLQNITVRGTTYDGIDILWADRGMTTIDRCAFDKIGYNCIIHDGEGGFTLTNSTIGTVHAWPNVPNAIGVTVMTAMPGLIANNTFETGGYLSLVIKPNGRGLANQGGPLVVENNSFVDNMYGLSIAPVETDVVVECNRFLYSRYYAIMVGDGLKKVSVHHNFFLKNAYNSTTGKYESLQAACAQEGSQWDDGAEGNYWSDYELRCPGATHDGRVWSEPYWIDNSPPIRDRFPLYNAPEKEPPVAIAGPDLSVDMGTTVTFNGLRSYDDFGIRSYNWSFFDGCQTVSLDGAVVTYLMENAGVFDVQLLVEDIGGNQATDHLTVTVRDTEAPRAEAGADITLDQGSVLRLNGSGSTDNVGISNWTWTFMYEGQDQIFFDRVVSFPVDTPGVFLVTLIVRDFIGNSAFDTALVTVLDAIAPHAEAGPDGTVEEGSIATLDGSGSTDNVGILNWTWVLTNGGTGRTFYGPSVELKLESPGVYNITLTVRDGRGNFGTDWAMLTVLDTTPPTPDAGADVTVDEGTDVTLDGTTSSDNVGVVGWTWSFTYRGSEVVLEGPKLSFRFDEPGYYLITLNATDAALNWALDDLAVLVRDITPPIPVVPDDASIDQGESLVLDGSASVDNVDVVAWHWWFEYGGEAVVLEGVMAGFTFSIPGIYVITLRVSDAWRNNATDFFFVMVRDTESPVAEASGETKTEVGSEIRLDGSRSSDNVGIENFTWVINGSGVEDLLYGKIVSHRFQTPGIFNVTLMVRDAAGNIDSSTLNVVVSDVPGGDGHKRPDGGLRPPVLLLSTLLALGLLMAFVLAWRRRSS